MTNMLIAQSGGPTSVINQSLYGAVAAGIAHPDIQHVYGSLNGVEGLLNGRLVLLDEKLSTLKQASCQPGAILGGSRYELAEGDLDRMISKMEELSIGIFCYIGGNGSSRTVNVLHHYAKLLQKDIRFVHIPKTIDNDLFGTDHTPGYASAAAFLIQSIQWIGADMDSLGTYDQIELIEVMGGNSGWLAAASAFGKQKPEQFPQLIYLPEKKRTLDQFLQEIELYYRKYKKLMVIVPDHFQVGEIRSASSANKTRKGFNGGISYTLSSEIVEKLGYKTRLTNPGSLYRSAFSLASRTDLEEAKLLGERAVEAAMSGLSGVMMCLKRLQNEPYLCKVEDRPLDDIAGRERKLPSAYWDDGTQMATPAFQQYLRPLIDFEIMKPLTI
ncbi:diphosphate--fructose-6-phosphate 1-phosphotransferase [Domibacillus robiginosus]|uniref:diphosphate--fructose-6-phosphate 1-phosphotransferase n=1 Tax=Domibacillus robiginosus TaxID=1071054 RepID=UPI00067E5E53|nr:diphosphate--fructose-6-phosphate 1-phosphotransferase [Domibacillus robiginosus]